MWLERSKGRRNKCRSREWSVPDCAPFRPTFRSYRTSLPSFADTKDLQPTRQPSNLSSSSLTHHASITPPSAVQSSQWRLPHTYTRTSALHPSSCLTFPLFTTLTHTTTHPCYPTLSHHLLAPFEASVVRFTKRLTVHSTESSIVECAACISRLRSCRSLFTALSTAMVLSASPAAGGLMGHLSSLFHNANSTPPPHSIADITTRLTALSIHKDDVKLLAKQDIDGDCLQYISEEALARCGVPTFGRRVKVVKAVEADLGGVGAVGYSGRCGCRRQRL